MKFRQKPGPLALLALLLLFSPLSASGETSAGEEGDGAAEPVREVLAAEAAPVPAASAGEGAAEPPEPAGAEERGSLGFGSRLGLAFLVLLIQGILIRLMWGLFKWFRQRAAGWGTKNIKPLTFKKLKILNTSQITEALLFSLRILKWLVTAFQLFITLPIIFSLFAATKRIAVTLFGYILSPLKSIVLGTVEYIPKLITIMVILFVTKYALRALKFFSAQIERGKLQIPGFYSDWAQPTFNILRVLLYAFTAAIIYPYLPGADSKFFQGISVFVGVIFSLGSSSAIGNLVAGMVITYMRPFKIGDFIKIRDLTGTVVEKSAFVVRIRNKKNEYITFPNLTVLTSEIINYNTSVDKEQGLVLHAEITMGYAVPWPRVQELLLAAADKTSRTEKSPPPFVLQSALDDFYARYEINVYTREINELPCIYSELYGNIQDEFRAAGIDLTAPRYEVRLSGGSEREARERAKSSSAPGQPKGRGRRAPAS
jgi:small-conductance mechanosensitive channel